MNVGLQQGPHCARGYLIEECGARGHCAGGLVLTTMGLGRLWPSRKQKSQHRDGVVGKAMVGLMEITKVVGQVTEVGSGRKYGAQKMRLVAGGMVQMVEGAGDDGLTMAVGEKQMVVMEIEGMKVEEEEVVMDMA